MSEHSPHTGTRENTTEPIRPRRFGTLGWRILFWTSLVALLPLLIMASQGYHCARQAVYDAKQAHLRSVLASGTALFEGRLDKVEDDLRLLSAVPCLIEDSAVHARNGRAALSEESSSLLKSVQAGSALYEDIQVFDLEGEPLGRGRETTPAGGNSLSADFKTMLRDAEKTVTAAMALPENDRIRILSVRPLFDSAGNKIAFLVARLNVSRSLDPAFCDRIGLGTMGRLLLLPPDAPYASARVEGSHHRHKDEEALSEKRSDAPPAVREYYNPQGVKVLGASAPLADLDWNLVAEFNWRDAFGWLRVLKIRAVATGSVTLVLVLFVAARGAGRLSQPLRELAAVARRIAAGSHDERLGRMVGTEAQEVSNAFNTMMDVLAASHRRLMHAASLAAVGELSSSTVHEMRNPLSSVKINLQALRGKVKDSPAHHELATIALGQVARVENMLSDLLGYGKPLDLELDRVPFKQLAGDVLAIVGNKAEEKSVSLTVEDRLGDTALTIDLEQIRRALTNLMTNAIQAAPAGGHVQLVAELQGEPSTTAAITVLDDGSGIPASSREQIFKPFFTTRDTGTGLGLANAKKIVDYHGGTLSAENRPEGGAAFVILLPLGGPPA